MKIPYIDDLVLIAEAAGDAAINHFRIGAPHQYKDDGTIVTGGDIAANKMITEIMESRFPNVCVIGEEGSGGAERSDWVVLVDPIDGSWFYRAGLTGWATGVSLLHKLQPVAAVIHDPVYHGTWTAVKGQGTFHNGERVRISYSGDLPGSTVSLVKWKGCPYEMEDVKEKIEEVGGKVLDPPSVVMAGGILASGGIHASVFPGAAAWETAAIQLIVEEAGGWASDMHGRWPIPYRWTDDGLVVMDGHIIAANRETADTLLGIVAHCNGPEY